MSLFVINRPEGEEGDRIPHLNQESQEQKLKKILDRINQRALKKKKAKKVEKKEKPIPPEEPITEPIPPEETKEQLPENPDIQEKKTKRQLARERYNKKEAKQKLDAVKGFTVLGETNSTQKAIVKRVLPKWLTHPTVISSNLNNSTVKYSKLKLLDKLLRDKLKANGVKYLFPVQAAVIPWILRINPHKSVIIPNDICVSAPTGSGKTLAFVLPLVQALQHHTAKKIRALVILPTQDLASQVYQSFRTYTQGTRLETGLITGINDFSNEQQLIVYEDETFGCVSKIDILVCTAGRLVQHLKATKGFSLQFLEFLVIDEADRVLDSVQDDWLYHLEKHLYTEEPSNAKTLNVYTLEKKRPPQKLLFSATLTQDPEKLQKLSLFQPKLFTCAADESNAPNMDDNEGDTFIGKFTTPENLTEKYVVCSKELKPLVLYKLIKREKLDKIIVFANSIESAHRLSILLRSLFKEKRNIEEMSSKLKGKARAQLLTKFREGDIDILICTGALARGMDLPETQCVILYSAPKYAKTYVHQVGRTARAGKSGLAITLVHEEHVIQFKKLLKGINKTNVEEIAIDEAELETLGDRYKKSLAKLKGTVDAEEQTMLKRINKQKQTVKQTRKFKKKKNETK